MISTWALGLLRRRAGRLLAAAFGIAIAVALLASLGSFLTASKATMTKRAVAGVAVDWQVAVRPNGSGTGVPGVLKQLHSDNGTLTALPVGFAESPGFVATTQGTTQTTGAGKVLGLPAKYAATFPKELRLLTGSLGGVLVAQQTAANLHVQPGDTVTVKRAGMKPFKVKISGVVDLPQADSLFQKVGAPTQSQPVAPPDNVLLIPRNTFTAEYGLLAKSRPDQVATQIHVRRTHNLPPDPAAAFVTEIGAAKNLEVATSGVGIVGDNLGAVLDGARQDALYAQVLFLFLAAPGAALAATLTAAVAQAGITRRRREQALLRARGSTTSQLFRLVLVEAGLIAIAGGAVGLLAALVIGRLAFGSTGFGATTGLSLAWVGVSFLVGTVIAALVIVVPARRDLKRPRDTRADAGRPIWLSYGLDVILIVIALAVFWAAGRNKYQLVLVPEGVPTLSVSYWAFLAPALAWIGAGFLGWRLADLLLGRGRGMVSVFMRPFAGNLANTTASMMSRQRRTIARSAVLVGLALSFAMSTATFNATYKHQAEVDAQLTNGADVTVVESPGITTPPRYANTLAQVPGAKAVEPMLHRLAYVGTDLQDIYGINPATITRATTLLDSYFQGASADQMLSRLASRPDAILVSAETVNTYQLKPGDLLRLRLQNNRTHAYQLVSFHYVGIVNEFPTAPKDSFIIANAPYLAKQTHSHATGTFLINTGGSNVNSIANQVHNVVGTSAKVSTINQARGLVGTSLTSVDLSGLTKLELSFALVIAAAAGGLVMALGLNERRRSIAVATVIGANRRQLRSLNLGEPIFVIGIGLLSGALTGWGLSYLLVKVLTGVFDPPPTSLTLPWPYLLAVVASSVGSIAAGSAYVAHRTRRHAREYLREI
jgi:putative ABC transport system permease protein